MLPRLSCDIIDWTIWPRAWLLRLRVEKVVALLARGGHSVAEIAHSTGFSSHAYFCQVIRKYTGRAPVNIEDIETCRADICMTGSMERGSGLLKTFFSYCKLHD